MTSVNTEVSEPNVTELWTMQGSQHPMLIER